MPTKTKSSRSIIGLKMDNGNDIVFENKTVANKFNTFFCSIADKLVEKLEKRTFDGNKLEEMYKMKRVKPNAFSFVNVNMDKVQKQLPLNVTKSVGCDGISARFLRKQQKLLPALLHTL